MNMKNIAIGITSIIVSLLVITGVMIPIVNTANYEPFDNPVTTNSSVNFRSMDLVKSPDTFDSVWEMDSENDVLTIDGVETAVTNSLGIVLYSNGGSMRINANALYLNCTGVTSQTTVNGDWTLTITDGVFTLVAGDVTYGWDGTSWILKPNVLDKGAYHVYSGTNTYYLNSLDDLYFAQNNNTLGFISGNGSVATGINADTTTSYDLDVTMLEVSGYGGLYTITAPSDIKLGDSDVSPSYIVLKETVMGESLDKGTALTLVNLLPLFVVVGLLIGVIGLFFRRT